MLHGSYDIRDIHADGAGESDAPARAFLRARANTIEGGTSEILRNILGERVLGLPGRHQGRQEHALDREPPLLALLVRLLRGYIPRSSSLVGPRVSSRTALLSRMCLRQKVSARSASRASM